ncbi:MAG: LytR C-terminal domain-containing protein [Eubacteriales bacterium]|nr:LytR C-terminal domain-containing protein [Eubacteriales bacterium]
MAKRQFYGQERNPLKMVIYILIVLVMTGCIGYLVCSSRQRRLEYTERVREAAAGETEYVAEKRQSETETETESETQTDTDSTEEKSGTEEDMVKRSSILVLNGTGKAGVAGYWKTQLEKAGYTNVSPVTYTGTVGEETMIYVSAKEQAEPLKQQFPNASVEIGEVEEGLEAAEGGQLPEQRDIFIVIGNKDARSE